MKKKFTIISPALFGLIILCFFLPFVAISCSGQEVVSISGFKLATGTSISNPMDGSVAQTIEGNTIILIGLLCAVAGLIFGIIKLGGLSRILSAGAGIVGFIMLLIFRINFGSQAADGMADMAEIGNMLKIDYKLGFWLSFILFLAAAGYNVYLIIKKPDLEPVYNDGSVDSAPAAFCPECGARMEENAVFCSECGAKRE